MDTKTQLLDSAERIARERGFDGFSYADLAAEVGIRKASIHHHFPSKSDLALALMKRYRETFNGELQKFSQKKSSAWSKINAYTKLYRETVLAGDKVCLCVAFSVAADRFDNAVLEELNGFHADAVNWLKKTLITGQSDGSVSSDVAPAKEAPAILALVEGAQLLARAANDVGRFDKAVASLSHHVKA